jgi:hypothetical protein
VRATLAAVLALAGASAVPATLPDLDQAPPDAVSIVHRQGRLLLVFASAVDNVGAGPLVVESRRYPLPTRLRYVRSRTHAHWHFPGFERYELRRVNGAFVGRDRKTGFCLNDAYETHALNRVARWTTQCARGRPDAQRVREGISPGFGDDYVPAKEGQSIDVADLPPGRYVLVHRANPDRVLRERSYANNAASILLDLRGARLRILARCPDSARCGT